MTASLRSRVCEPTACEGRRPDLMCFMRVGLEMPSISAAVVVVTISGTLPIVIPSPAATDSRTASMSDATSAGSSDLRRVQSS